MLKRGNWDTKTDTHRRKTPCEEWTYTATSQGTTSEKCGPGGASALTLHELHPHSSPVRHPISRMREPRPTDVQQGAHSLLSGNHARMLTLPAPSWARQLPGAGTAPDLFTSALQACRPGQTHNRRSLSTAWPSSVTPWDWDAAWRHSPCSCPSTHLARRTSATSQPFSEPHLPTVHPKHLPTARTPSNPQEHGPGHPPVHTWARGELPACLIFRRSHTFMRARCSSRSQYSWKLLPVNWSGFKLFFLMTAWAHGLFNHMSLLGIQLISKVFFLSVGVSILYRTSLHGFYLQIRSQEWNHYIKSKSMYASICYRGNFQAYKSKGNSITRSYNQKLSTHGQFVFV